MYLWQLVPAHSINLVANALKLMTVMVPNHGAGPECMSCSHDLHVWLQHKSCIHANSLMPGCQHVLNAPALQHLKVIRHLTV